VSLHPEGFARRTRNFTDWSSYLLRQLDEAVRRTRSAELLSLADEVSGWPGIAPRSTWSRLHTTSSDPIVPWIVEHRGTDLSFVTAMATFGTPSDITLAELTVEMFFPADAATEAHLAARVI
ncbi:MAG: Transcriptional regulator, Cro/CI family, partial [Ilumatobacteraceae bacterium]|nr:Transcriptional regulator, Cro/CI family [Ilumatobacteraceae bacterium]